MKTNTTKYVLQVLVSFVIFSLLFSLLGTPAVAKSTTDQAASPASDLEQCFSGQSELAYSSHTGLIRFIGTAPGMAIKQPRDLAYFASAEGAARNYLSVCGPLFGLSDQEEELLLLKVSHTEDGRSVVRFQQIFQGIPVFGAEIIIQLDADNNIILVNGDLLPNIDLNPIAITGTPEAQQSAVDLVAVTYGVASEALTVSDPELMVYDPGILQPEDGETVLVWKVEVTPVELAPIRQLVLLNARSGEVVLDINQLDTAKNRMTYTAGNTTTRPGTLVCDESDPTCSAGDPHAQNAHIYAGDTYDFYLSYHGRDSIDNAGMTLISTVHYSNGYCNAFWDGSQMTYGDGCSIVVDDVVAHEMTHGVTEYRIL